MSDSLKTVYNYSKILGVTTSRVYQMIKEGKVKVKIIDGMKFVIMDKR